MELEKDEVKEHLIKIGILPEIVRMPAVIEALKKKIRKTEDVEVDVNGNIVFTNNEGKECTYNYNTNGAISLIVDGLEQESFFSNSREDIPDYNEETANQNRLGFFKTKLDEMSRKNNEYEERLILLKLFAQRCTKIPFMGRRISNILMHQTQMLEAPQEQKVGSNTELGRKYKNFLDEKERSRKYKAAYGSLRKCLVEDCGRVPFFGRRVLRNLEKFQKELQEKEDKEK